MSRTPRVETGLERLLGMPELVRGRRWALLANHAAVTAGLDPARVAMRDAGCGTPALLLAPEHGLDGVAQDMESVGDARDPVTDVPVRSLYGTDVASLAPSDGDLDGLDVAVVDVPDIGTRYYTFAASVDATMAVCARRGVEVVVLDRPNPIGGVARTGGMVRPGFGSFVSQLPTPVRHGLTLGELALLLQRERYPDLELTVVTCQGWARDAWWDATGLPWVPPSPNMPTLDTAALYPGLCLVEATTLSEGRGTTRPFHLVGAPWVEPERLVAALRGLELEGIGFRPARFRPEFQKHAGRVCGGVELHILEREGFDPLQLGLELLRAFHDHDPERFEWRPDPYEFVADVPALDLLTGSAEARRVVEAGEPLEPLLAGWADEVTAFEESLDGVLLYPAPRSDELSHRP